MEIRDWDVQVGFKRGRQSAVAIRFQGRQNLGIQKMIETDVGQYVIMATPTGFEWSAFRYADRTQRKGRKPTAQEAFTAAREWLAGTSQADA
jgi:hypothetical protein